MRPGLHSEAATAVGKHVSVRTCLPEVVSGQEVVVVVDVVKQSVPLSFSLDDVLSARPRRKLMSKAPMSGGGVTAGTATGASAGSAAGWGAARADALRSVITAVAAERSCDRIVVVMVVVCRWGVIVERLCVVEVRSRGRP